MKDDRVPFWSDEIEELQKANAVRQKIRAARKQRQRDHDRREAELREERLSIAAEVERIRKEKKDRFDTSVRAALLEVTHSLADRDLTMVFDGARAMWGDRIFAFSISNGGIIAKIYWRYGMGFEWDV